MLRPFFSKMICLRPGTPQASTTRHGGMIQGAASMHQNMQVSGSHSSCLRRLESSLQAGRISLYRSGHHFLKSTLSSPYSARFSRLLCCFRLCKGTCDLKWIWFAVHRPVSDFDCFDAASQNLGELSSS